MWERIILTTFLLLIFLGLRYIIDGKISARFQYALWLFIAIRLLCAWFPLPDSAISILPLVRNSAESVTQMVQDIIHPGAGEDGSLADRETIVDLEKADNSKIKTDSKIPIDDEIKTDSKISMDEEITTDSEISIGDEITTDSEISIGDEITADNEIMANDSDNQQIQESGVQPVQQSDSLHTESEDGRTETLSDGKKQSILSIIYGIGVVILFFAILLHNLLFYLRLKKLRIPYEGELPFTHIPGKVYLLEHITSPFLFGRNIYIAPEMMQDTDSLRYCLVHETCHYRQGDMFWSAIRNLCLVMYWYHPMVWLCVRLSANDGELACDERAILVLGEEHRLSYGETLLALIKKQTWSSDHFSLSTQMSGSKCNVKKRMQRISQKKKQCFTAVIFIMIGMAVALLSTLPNSLSGNADEWSRVIETEGFPAMIIDEDGNVVDFVRGNLLRKMYFSYYNSERSYSIQENAFSNCSNLKTLIIDELVNIEEIAYNAFDGCPKDMTVYCQKDSDVWDYFQKKGYSVKEYVRDQDDPIHDWLTLGENPKELKKIADKITAEIDRDNPALTREEMRKVYGEPYFIMMESGIIPIQDHSESLHQYMHSELRFPKEATILGATFAEFLFWLPDTVTIPSHIVEIGNGAFQDCEIGQVEFEEGSKLEKIGRRALAKGQFSEITLPEGLKIIGSRAFESCERLKEITIPASVEKIGEQCFILCGDLETVTILNPDTEFMRTEPNTVFDQYIYSEEKQDMVPNTKLTIRCYQGSTAETYAKELNLKVEYLSGSPDDNRGSSGDKAFAEEWTAVAEKDGFPAMVVDEDGNIVDFVRGQLMQKMYLSYYGNDDRRRPYSIKEKAFSNCTNLKTLIIKDVSYIADIAPSAFEGCPKDMVVYCAEGSAVWKHFSGMGFHVEEYDPDENSSIGDWLTLGENPEELKKIAGKITGEHHSPADPELTDQEMRQVYGEPYFVMTQSGRLAGHQEMKSLLAYSETGIHFPKEAKVLDRIFADYILEMGKIMIPENVTELRGYDFYASEITGLEFEKGSKLKKIGVRSFLGNSFTTVELPEGLQELGREAFYQCADLKEIIIPSSVKKIEESCFGKCDALETVTILSKDAEFVGDKENEYVFPDTYYSEEEEETLPNTKLTIRCYKGSTAEQYAKKLNLKVEYIGGNK